MTFSFDFIRFHMISLERKSAYDWLSILAGN